LRGNGAPDRGASITHRSLHSNNLLLQLPHAFTTLNLRRGGAEIGPVEENKDSENGELETKDATDSDTSIIEGRDESESGGGHKMAQQEQGYQTAYGIYPVVSSESAYAHVLWERAGERERKQARK